MVTSTAELEKLLGIVREFTYKWKMVLNHTKDAATSFGLMNELVEWTKVTPLLADVERMGVPRDALKYLGFMLDGPTGSWRSHMENRIKTARTTFALIRAREVRHGKIEQGLAVEVFETILMMKVFYGGEIISLSENELKDVDKELAKMIRTIYGLVTETGVRWVLWEAGIYCTKTMLEFMTLRYWRKLVKRDKIKESCTLVETIVGDKVRMGHGCYFMNIVKQALEQWGLQEWMDKELPGKKKWKSLLKDRADVVERQRFCEWVRVEKRDDQCILKMKKGLRRDENIHSLDERQVKRLVQVRAKTRRFYDGMVMEEGWVVQKCPLCELELDTVEHMVLECKWEDLGRARKKWLPRIMETFTGRERRKWNAAGRWENGEKLDWLVRSGNRSKRLVVRMECVADMLDEMLQFKS
jgi:hypothetical protein